MVTRRDTTSPGPEADWLGPDRFKDVDRPSLEGDGRGVLEGAFRLLRALPDAGRGHQIRELARITGVPRPSVYRLLAQLRAVGAVERPRDHYVLAQSFVEIARRTEPTPGLRWHAGGVMRALRARTGATVSLVIPTEQGCSALEVIPGRESLPTPIHAGVAMPRNAAAALVLDPMPAPQRVDRLAGWASDDARVYPDLTCYASAIRVAGRIEAVLQISTTSSRPAEQFATLIRLGADRIGTQLSSQP
jgi:DNA-binding IclR family transcriptional regulator